MVGVTKPGSPYNSRYRRQRAALLGMAPWCHHCRERRATEADHQPPLSLHVHREGSGCCQLVPSCKPCRQKQAVAILRGQIKVEPPRASRLW